MSARSSLRGVGALLASLRPNALRIGGTFALLTLAVGAVTRLGGVEDVDPVALSVALVVIAALGPLVVGLPWTMSVGAGAPPRRDELLLLPMGRLALPAAVLVGGALVALAAVAGLLAALLVVFGPGALVAAAGALDHVPWWGPALVFAGAFFLGALGGSAAVASATWWLGPALVAAAAPMMGYERADVAGYLALWLAAFAAFLLVVPFLLYARPVHVWAASNQPGERAPGAELLTTSAGLLALGLAGVGWALLGVVAVGGLARARARRQHPARGGGSALRLAHGVALALAAPLVLAGLIVDARAGAERLEDLVPVHAAFSPDARHAVIISSPRAGGRVRPTTKRALVLDLTGQRPPRLLPPRFACLPDGLDAAAWSTDGRWVAVHDLTRGRLHLPPLGMSHFRAELRLVQASAVAGTIFYDTATGDVVRAGPRVLAAGWRHPDELVEARPRLRGGWTLRDAAGRALHLPAFELAGYDAGRPLVAPVTNELRLDAVAGALVVRSAQRWDGEALVAPALDRGRWVWRAAHDGEASRAPRRPALLERDGVELRLEAVAGVLLEACTADAVVFYDDEGLVRRRLQGGEREVLLPRAGAERLVTRWAAPDGRLVLVRRDDEVWAIDLEGGRATCLGPHEGAIAPLDGGVVVLRSGRWPRLRGPDGRERSLAPWAP